MAPNSHMSELPPELPPELLMEEQVALRRLTDLLNTFPPDIKLRVIEQLLLERTTLPSGFRRKYQNGAEHAFHAYAATKGWRVTKQGWPDFACFSLTGRFACVEVKPEPSSGFEPHQVEVLTALSRYGVPTYAWDPKRGFRKVAAPR